MSTAAIIFQQSGDLNLTPGSRDDLILNTPVILLNQDNTGITSWLWTIMDRPINSSASLVSPTSSTTTFTPDIIGTYLIKLSINAGSVHDEKGVAIKTTNLQYRIPAASETVEFDSSRGWATALDFALQQLDDGYGDLESRSFVSQVNTGTGLTGGPITSTGTISMTTSGVTAASYGSATQVTSFTVDATGRLTAASNTTITGLPESAITGLTSDLSSKAPTSRSINTTSARITGGGDLSADRTLDLAISGITANTYQGIAFDIYGRATSASNQSYLTIASAASTYLPLAGGTITGLLSNSILAIGTAQTVGISLVNTTAATNGAQQYSPSLVLQGEGFKTTGSLSKTNKVAIQLRPIQGTSTIPFLDFLQDADGTGSFTRALFFDLEPGYSGVFGASAEFGIANNSGTGTYAGIDFLNNTIRFYHSGTLTWAFDTSGFHPNTTNTYSIGDSTHVISNVFATLVTTPAITGNATPVTVTGGTQTETSTAAGLIVNTPANWLTTGNIQLWKNNGTTKVSLYEENSLAVNIIHMDATTNYFWLKNAAGDSIKMSGGAAIYFGIGGTSVNYQMTAGNFLPQTNGNVDLGLSGQYWRDVLATRNLVGASVGPNTTNQHTLPAVTSDTVALIAATQTLTNKTIDGNNNTITNVGPAGTIYGVTILVWGALFSSGNTTQEYLFPGGPSETTDSTQRRVYIPTAGVVRNLYVWSNTAYSGGSAGVDYTINKNGVATAVTCNQAIAATTGSDITHSFSVAAGDYLSVGKKGGTGVSGGAQSVVASFSITAT